MPRIGIAIAKAKTPLLNAEVSIVSFCSRIPNIGNLFDYSTIIRFDSVL